MAWASHEGGSGSPEIYTRSYPGGGGFFISRCLTTNTTFDGQPAFSPDGSKIAFTSFRDGNFEIYVMSTSDTNPADGNGDNPTRLTNNTASGLEPAWSPDGTKIAFTSGRDSNDEVYVMDADGSDQLNLTKKAAATDDSPNWSPDGTKIAFESNRGGDFEIFVMKANKPESKRNRPNNLTKNDVNDIVPDWRPIP